MDCNNLKNFYFSNIKLSSKNTTDLIFLLKSKTDFYGLDLSYTNLDKEIFSFVIQIISEKFDQLRTFKMNVKRKTISSENINNLMEKNKNLITLELNGIRINEKIPNQFFNILIGLKDLRKFKSPKIIRKEEESTLAIDNPYKNKDDILTLNLKSLHLTFYNFADAFGFKYLFESKSGLKEIMIDDSKFERIHQYFQENSCLKYQPIEKCKLLSQNVLQYLLHSIPVENLVSLDISNNSLESEFLESFTENISRFSSLKKLNISNNLFKNEEIENFFKKLISINNSISFIEFHSQQLTNSIILNIIQLIYRNEKIYFINSNDPFEKDTLTLLPQNCINTKLFNIHFVNYVYTEFKDFIEKKLLILNSNKTNIHSFSFYIKKIFKNISQIESLNISQPLSEENALIIGNFIKNQNNLKNFTFGDENKTLLMHKETMEAIFPKKQFFVYLENITIKNVCLLPDKGYIYLANFIGHQINLSRLVLSKVNISGKEGRILFQSISENLCKLREIDLSYSTISSDMSKDLGNFLRHQLNLNILNLTSVNLSDLCGERVFKNLSSDLDKLIELYLADTNINVKSAIEIGKFLGNQDNLSVLDLMGIKLKGEIGKFLLNPLSASTKIKLKKFLYSTDIDYSLIVSVQENLTHVYKDGDILTNNDKLNFSQYLSNNLQTLNTLNLANFDLLWDEQGRFFKNFLEKCNELLIEVEKKGRSIRVVEYMGCREIHLKGIQMNELGFLCLGKFIRQNVFLRDLTLSGLDLTGLNGSIFFKEICDPISEADFKSNLLNRKSQAQIFKLNLNKSIVSPSTAVIISDFINFQDCLSELNLSGVDLTKNTGVSLFENCSSSSIMVLNLSSIQISDCGVEALGKFIYNLKKLYHLDLSKNYLNYKFEKLLKNAKNIQTLIYLDLSHCTYLPDVAKHITFFKNDKIIKLNLIGTISNKDLDCRISSRHWRLEINSQKMTKKPKKKFTYNMNNDCGKSIIVVCCVAILFSFVWVFIMNCPSRARWI